MKTRIRQICAMLLLAGLQPGCRVPIEDPFKVIPLTPLKDHIPYEALGTGKIVFNRITQVSNNDSGFYIIDIDKKTADGFDLVAGILNPSISPDGTKIACALNNFYGTAYDIYIMNIDGSNCYPVYQSPHQDFYPSWSPDGTRIIFHGGWIGPLYIQSPVEDPADRVELIGDYYPTDHHWELGDSGHGGFSMSPGGQLVRTGRVYDSYGIVKIDPSKGTPDVSLVLPSTYLHRFESPAFSPDGQKIAFLTIETDSLAVEWKSVEVKSMNADGTNVTQLAEINPAIFFYSVGGFRNISLCWSPDGTKILFTVPIEEYGCHLFFVNSDGSGLTQVTDDVKAFDLDVSWSR